MSTTHHPAFILMLLAVSMGVGLADALLLLGMEFDDSTNCPTPGENSLLSEGCSPVLSSRFARLEIYGTVIPVALLGVLYYAVILIYSRLLIIALDRRVATVTIGGERGDRLKLELHPEFLSVMEKRHVLMDNIAVKAFKALVLIGLLVSFLLIYLQIAVIEAICPFCMFSALICILNAVLTSSL